MAQSDKSRNFVAALSYFLGFITGVVILLVEKDDKFIRFHAMQSTVVFGFFFILNILIGIIFGNLSFLGFLATVINTLISIAVIIVWIVSMIKAYQGQIYKWPWAGDFAERQVK
ncbi:MAG: DUF4870 domain-containing protein [Candidatus Curtissbacteria bacterium]|nr:DUF4870 domain-containing protein [Candidatus Curtissbacteria bacterium]